MTKTTYLRTCERCGDQFSAGRPQARFCNEACRKAAARLRAKAVKPVAAPAPMTKAEALEELDAALYLLPLDIECLAERFPEGEMDDDPVMDDVIGGLETHLLGLKKVRAWAGTVS